MFAKSDKFFKIYKLVTKGLIIAGAVLSTIGVFISSISVVGVISTLLHIYSIFAYILLGLVFLVITVPVNVVIWAYIFIGATVILDYLEDVKFIRNALYGENKVPTSAVEPQINDAEELETPETTTNEDS